MVLCRKSTLLCRQEVRRSMVFSTVQISMPGTSCARPSTVTNRQGSNADAASAIRPIIKILIQAISAVNLSRANCEPPQDITPKPHSRAEVCRVHPVKPGDRLTGWAKGMGGARELLARAWAIIKGESLHGNARTTSGRIQWRG